MKTMHRKATLHTKPATYTRAALFGEIGPAGETIPSVYGYERLEYLRQHTQMVPTIITRQNFQEHLPELAEVEVIFATWGMFCLTSEQLDRMPRLRAVFYAAGTVKNFAWPFLERGITVVSAWAANAVPVAEFALGQILLANKGYFRNRDDYKDAADYSTAFRGRGNYGATVSLLGVGQIGLKLLELLRPFHLRVLVFDPFLSQKAAEQLGGEKVELAEAFACGDVVSNHLANVPQTVDLLNGSLFASMPKNATFINTGRGATVAQDEMISVLQSRPDLTALLDVTAPEPLPASSPLRDLPNVHITSHIAGSIGDEVGRMADTILAEFEAWESGRPLRYAVTSQMLENMA